MILLAGEKLGGNFSHALYLCHRASLLGPFDISVGVPQDKKEILEFLDDDPDRQAYVDVLDGKATASTVFVVRVFGQIAGVVRARKCATPGVYTKFYEVCVFVYVCLRFVGYILSFMKWMCVRVCECEPVCERS